jgi:hypothetical protein
MLDLLSILCVTLPCLFVVVRALMLDKQLAWFRVVADEAPEPVSAPSRSPAQRG